MDTGLPVKAVAPTIPAPVEAVMLTPTVVAAAIGLVAETLITAKALELGAEPRAGV